MSWEAFPAGTRENRDEPHIIDLRAESRTLDLPNMKQEGIPLSSDILWSYWELLQHVKMNCNNFQTAETFVTTISKQLKRSANRESYFARVCL
jgi:hypothetical protein